MYAVLAIFISSLTPPWEGQYRVTQTGHDLLLEERVRVPRLTLLWEWEKELIDYAFMLGVYLPGSEEE